jgi:hypothetical protein
MSKIYTEAEYTIQVYGGDIQLTGESNPHILTPHRVYKEGLYKYLVYKVTGRGKTLRNFIADLNKPHERISFRDSFRRTKVAHITTIDLLLLIIDTYDELLSKNRLLSQTHINPDMIWVDYDIHNKINVRLLDILDYELVDDNINESIYLSPELLGKRNHLLYNSSGTGPIKMSLNRYDTRPSTLSSVYSIGLVLYFMITNNDPYVGSRVDVYERPCLDNIPPLYSKIIWVATNANQKERPTIKDFREMVLRMHVSDKYPCITNIFG